MTPEQIQHAKDLLDNPDNTVSSIARLLSVSRATSTSTSPSSAPLRYLPDRRQLSSPRPRNRE
jgi:hypothetical protein